MFSPYEISGIIWIDSMTADKETYEMDNKKKNDGERKDKKIYHN